MRRIGLIACSSRKCKEAEADHDKEFPACDMYIGTNFKKAVSKGLSILGCEDDYYILSDNIDYGLLSPDELIKYYDINLRDQDVAYRKAWGDKVYAQLIKKLGNLNDIEFIFFSPCIYYEYLRKKPIRGKAIIYKGHLMTFNLKNI